MNLKTLSDEDYEWLISMRSKDGQTSTPRISPEDEERIVRIVREHGLPCILEAWEYGLGIVIHDLPRQSGDDPKRLLCIDASRIFRGDVAEDARRIGRTLTHTPENLKILEFFRFAALKDPVEYCY